MSDEPLYSLRNPWFSAGVGVTAVIAVLAALAGLIWLPLAQPKPEAQRHLGRDLQRRRRAARAATQAASIQPDFKTSHVVVTSQMLTQAAARFRSAAAPRSRSAARSATGRRG